MAKRINVESAAQRIIGVPDKTNISSETGERAEREPARPASGAKKEKLQGVYLTEELRRAIKLRIALSDAPEDKDISSIARAALTAYLADTLEEMRRGR